MQTTTAAEEHLRVIRSLMERATIYRAVSSPGALVGGVCAVAVAVGGFLVATPHGGATFFTCWLGVLVVTAAVNFFLLRRDAVRRGELFFSPGMRLALRAMLPGLLGGAFCSVVATVGGCALVASLWVLSYGISLLAASHFAPRSIRFLGRVFFVAGAALLAGGTLAGLWRYGSEDVSTAHLMMGSTFGLFHLVYAACTWPRSNNTGK